jgi:hypothetical protein
VGANGVVNSSTTTTTNRPGSSCRRVEISRSASDDRPQCVAETFERFADLRRVFGLAQVDEPIFLVHDE